VVQSSRMAPPKTSQSDPLQIARVEIPDGGGLIGLTFCPGKKHHGLHAGRWDRDLRTDLEVIQSFGAKALVTLMEEEELRDVQVPAELLGSWAKEYGLEWHHLPIKDVSVPDATFEDLWTYSGVRLRSLLARGKNVVIHCLGGLGRTGAIAGRLLVEFGDQPQAAIQKVRQKRPGSIENSAQEQYVSGCGPEALSRIVGSPKQRALACLIGGAVGDAFGYAVEFSDLSEIRKRFGERGIQAPAPQQGKLVVSDDTQMTLFTLEGLLLNREHGKEWRRSFTSSIRAAYLDWLDTQNNSRKQSKTSGNNWLAAQPVMRVRRAPGNTCLAALGLGGRGTIEKAINDSKGCGGVMRVAPIGLVGGLARADEVFRLGAESAALTHGHVSGYLSAGMMASVVQFLAQGANLAAAIKESSTILREFTGHEETLNAVNLAIKLASKDTRDHEAAIRQMGGGWVGEEALGIGLYAVLTAESFVEAIAIAANHDGDSDSTASIAGQLWGAMRGLGGIPHEWIVNLDVLLPLLRLMRQFNADA
jgi:ADP-ribosyl-[dinitrogen reductase] hydrolase